MKDKTPEEQLSGFIARDLPEIGALARSALSKMRKRLPSGFRTGVRQLQCARNRLRPDRARLGRDFFRVALYPRWVSLFFLHAGIPDPQKLLKVGGKAARHIVLERVADLDKPAVKALMKRALERCVKPMDSSSPGRIIIKSNSAKQRPRRPA
ncbi:MAG: DUF1801 domain-containing protein [Chloracidobacterium sp.]|nr:DUF1801 domain-containing protein [Chloracidobacterium sp.]